MATKPPVVSEMKRNTSQVERKQRAAPRMKSYTDLGTAKNNFNESTAAQNKMSTLPSKFDMTENGGTQQRKQVGRWQKTN